MNRRDTALLLAVLALWAGCKRQDHKVTVEKRNAAEGGPQSQPRPAAAARPAARPPADDGGIRQELEQARNDRATKIAELEKVDADLGTMREEMQKLSAPDAPADDSTLDRLDKLAADIDEHTRRKEALEGEIAASESRERDLEARVGSPLPVAEEPAEPAPVAEAPAEPAPAAEPPADDPVALEIRMLEEERGRLTDPATPQTPETERKARNIGERLAVLYAERDAKSQPPAPKAPSGVEGEPVAETPAPAPAEPVVEAPVEPPPPAPSKVEGPAEEPVAAAPVEPAPTEPAPAEPAVEPPPAEPAPAEPVVEAPPPAEPAPAEPPAPAPEAPSGVEGEPVAEAPAPAEPAPATEPAPADHSAEEAAARRAARMEAADAEWAKTAPEVESLVGSKKYAAAISRLRNYEATYPDSAHAKDAADSLQFILQAARDRISELKSEADALTAEGKTEEATARLQEAKDLDDLASGRSASFRLAAGNENYFYEEVWGDVIRSVKAELERYR